MARSQPPSSASAGSASIWVPSAFTGQHVSCQWLASNLLHSLLRIADGHMLTSNDEYRIAFLTRHQIVRCDILQQENHRRRRMGHAGIRSEDLADRRFPKTEDDDGEAKKLGFPGGGPLWRLDRRFVLASSEEAKQLREGRTKSCWVATAQCLGWGSVITYWEEGSAHGAFAI